jgi:hypothetical protein
MNDGSLDAASAVQSGSDDRMSVRSLGSMQAEFSEQPSVIHPGRATTGARLGESGPVFGGDSTALSSAARRPS